MKALFCGLLLLAGCEREPFPEIVGFTFQIPFTLTPIRDTLAVGDTLWLTADFSDQLLELNSGQRYPVTPTNFELRTRLGIFRLADPTKYLTQQPGATAAFTFVNKVGAVTRPNTTFSTLTYSYSPGRYYLRVGLIPQRQGIFSINLGDGWSSREREENEPDLSHIDLGVDQDGVKRRPVFETIFYDINDGQTNFSLLQQHSLLTSINNPTASNINFEQKATYTFVVK